MDKYSWDLRSLKQWTVISVILVNQRPLMAKTFLFTEKDSVFDVLLHGNWDCKYILVSQMC